MSFIPNFSISQTQNAAQFTITDTSVGNDSSIADRQVFLQEVDGSYLTPSNITTDYIDFPLIIGSSETINCLTQDFALNITVNWLNSAGAILYTKTALYCFNQYAVNFAYYLLQQQTANPSLPNIQNFWQNTVRLFADIYNASNAVTIGNDQYSAQICLDDAYFLIQNQTNLFA